MKVPTHESEQIKRYRTYLEHRYRSGSVIRMGSWQIFAFESGRILIADSSI